MTGNIELLNYIHQNAQMGKVTLAQLIKISEDEEFKKVLESQLKEYCEIFEVSDKKIKELNKDSKDINPLAKISGYIMINMNTLLNKSSYHISEMVIQGSTMGIVDITKKMKEYKDAEKEILSLADKLLKFEQNNIEQLKKFL